MLNCFPWYTCWPENLVAGGGIVTKSCPTLVAPWTAVLQAPLSKRFPRQESWTGLPFPSPGDLPYQGIEPTSPVWHMDSLPLSHLGNPQNTVHQNICCFSFSLPFFFSFYKTVKSRLSIWWMTQRLERENHTAHKDLSKQHWWRNSTCWVLREINLSFILCTGFWRSDVTSTLQGKNNLRFFLDFKLSMRQQCDEAARSN